MPVRNLLEDIHAEPFPEFHHALLVAGWAEMTALARKSREARLFAGLPFAPDDISRLLAEGPPGELSEPDPRL